MNVKIDIHESNSDLERRIKSIERWGIQSVLKKDILKFLNDLGAGKVNKGKQATARTQAKYVSLLRCPFIYFKNISKVTKKQLEEFDKKLTNDNLKPEKKKAFSHSMKRDIRLAFKVFLKWRFGKKGETMTDFFDLREKKKTPDYLKESEINSLHKACITPRDRFIVSVLFDSGARIEEFLNIRYEDIELPEGNDNYVRLTLKSEFSKTEGRVISLYWNKTLEAVNDYLKERRNDGIKTGEPVCDATYNGLRVFLRRLGLRVLGKSVNPHLFRHSSATHYASKLNRQELCYRYGWKFSSDMPDVYISRAGMNSKAIDEKFSNTELGELKAQLEKEKFERSKLKSTMDGYKLMLDSIIDAPEIQKILEKSKQKQKEFDAKINLT